MNPALNTTVFTIPPRPASYGTNYGYKRGCLDAMLEDKIEGAPVVDVSPYV